MLLKKLKIFKEEIIFIRTSLNWNIIGGNFCHDLVHCIYSIRVSELNKCTRIYINGKSLFSMCTKIGMDDMDKNMFTYIPHQTKYVKEEI